MICLVKAEEEDIRLSGIERIVESALGLGPCRADKMTMKRQSASLLLTSITARR